MEDTEDSKEIQINLTRQDFVDFNVYYADHSSIVKRQRLVLLLPGVMWSGFWLWVCFPSDDPMKNIRTLMPLIIGGPMYIATLLLLWRGGVRRQIERHIDQGDNRAILGPQRVLLSPEGISDMSEFSQSTTRWEAVEKVEVTQENLYVYINALAAVIVPRRFFPDEASYEEFCAAAQHYYSQANSNSQ